MKTFRLIKKFRGYREKTEETNLGPGFLVKGSQNVLFNDGERIQIRKGFTLDGDADASLTPIESSFEWATHRGVEIPLRAFDDKIQFRTTITGSTVWQDLLDDAADAFTSVAFNFTTFWDTTEGQDFLLFVNGTSDLFDWSGGIATFASATSNTITKEGDDTWGELGFLLTGTRRIIIGGIAYAYTGGEGTTTLTGVTPDPTGGGHSAGDIAHQQMRTNADQPSSSFNAELISVLNNQIWVGNTKNRQVFVSKNTDFTDYTFSSPRLPGEGALLTLDNAPTGFQPLDETMVISAGKDDYYNSSFTLSDDMTKEVLEIKKMKTAPQEAAISQGAMAKMKNAVIMLTNEPTLDSLGRIENIDNNQSKPLSDPVKSLFDRLTFTNAHIQFFENNIYIAVPSETLVLVYNLEQGFWEAPQVLPVRRFAIINGELYGHSSTVPETYKLFDGRNDNGKAISANARFSYQNFGRRAWQKSFDEMFTEGFISSNTELTLTIKYDYKGATSIQEYIIDGEDTDIIVNTDDLSSLGKNSLGKKALGGSFDILTDVIPPKFRVIHTMDKQDFYEFQVEYSSSDIDFNWELLAFGPNVKLSKSDNISIKK